LTVVVVVSLFWVLDKIRCAQQFDYSDCVLWIAPFFVILWVGVMVCVCVVYCYWVSTKQQLHSDLHPNLILICPFINSLSAGYVLSELGYDV
jgi:hypothetical protein